MKPMVQFSFNKFDVRPIALLLFVGMAVWQLPMAGQAAEPYEKFLQRLRSNGYYDLALVYLDDAKNSRGLDPKFQSVIELERALLYFQAASVLPPKAPQRAEKLNQTEKFLRKFITDSPQHQRRGEARLKLGGLLRMRAEESIALAGPSSSEQGVPEAVNFFDAAHKLYEEAIAELAQIETTLRGARVDPKDTEKLAYRNQVRLDLREAQLYSAKAIEDRGKSRGSADPARQADLEQSLKMYSDLYAKESSLAGIRTFALLYRSGVQATLGKKEDAIDGYQRIVDMENVDQLRPLQTEALTELIQVLASEEKFQPAVDRADSWISKLRPDERDAAEVLALKLAHAKVRVAWMKKLATSDEKLASKIEKAVRTDLRGLIRIPGSHVEEAKNILASLGVESGNAKVSVDLPKVKDLPEAIEESRKRIDDADNNALAIAVLDEQINDANTPAEQKTALTAQRSSQQEQVDQLRRNAIELLRSGLQKYDGKKDDRTQLFNARFSMAYLWLKLKDTREAIVVGEFLSRTSPGTPQGLNAAAIVLEGYSSLLKNAAPDDPALMTELAPFAEYLVATWPQSIEASAASGALTQLAIISKNWDQAEKYLQQLPSTSPGVGRQYFDLGAALFDQYQKSIRDKSVDEATISGLRERSAKWMKLANETISIDDSTASVALAAANALAQIRLSQNQVEEASQLMFSGDKAPMNWIDSKLNQVSPASAMDLYRTVMRITAAQVVDGKVDAKKAAQSMQSYVSKLQELGNKSDDGRQRLQQIFTGIATDLKEKLAMVKQAGKRAELSDVVLIVVSEAAKSDSYNTQLWAASTLVSMAEGLESQGKSSSASEQIFGKAAELLRQMLAKINSQPDWGPEGAANTLRIDLARASEGMNNLRSALQAYAEILDENSGYLDVQMGVARTLQKLAANDAKLYKSAIGGARPHPKTKENIFWGWGKISQEASKRIANFSEQFYEARYQLAQCRWRYALTLSDPKARQKELSVAEKSINDTVALYPGLGGAADVQRYDALIKQIQKEAGKPETGLTKP
jgi:tetratricopeptide (TPR) repeat protein